MSQNQMDEPESNGWARIHWYFRDSGGLFDWSIVDLIDLICFILFDRLFDLVDLVDLIDLKSFGESEKV